MRTSRANARHRVRRIAAHTETCIIQAEVRCLNRQANLIINNGGSIRRRRDSETRVRQQHCQQQDRQN